MSDTTVMPADEKEALEYVARIKGFYMHLFMYGVFAVFFLGMFGLKWLVDHGALPKDKLEEYYASYVGGIFRTARFGVGEAHGRAEMMEFNYLSERGAIKRDASGKYFIDYTLMPGAISDLAKELLETDATGDRDRAEKWFAKYDKMPDDLKASLDRVTDVPVDIDPIFSFKDTVR